MKKITVLLAAFAVFAACSRDVTPEPELVTLQMNILPGSSTKADVTGHDDTTLEKVQVLVFDKNGNLETATDNVDFGTSISMSVVPGTKTIWAVGNETYKLFVSNLNDLMYHRYCLEDENFSKFIMSDSKENISVTTSGQLNFGLKRLACKIVIDKIVRQFNQAAYGEIPLVIKKIYLSNVCDRADVAAQSIIGDSYNVQMGIIGNLDASLKAKIVDDGLDITLFDGDDHTATHTFYAYPNGATDDAFGGENFSPRRTRLVLECLYNGALCYYPITLPAESGSGRGTLDRNTVYHISSLILTRPGSPDPDVPADEVSSIQNCTFNITCSPWDGNVSYTETFN